jgi:hypothetical protein
MKNNEKVEKNDMVKFLEEMKKPKKVKGENIND